jgi:uncharacterized coiled-coil protein SlyX
MKKIIFLSALCVLISSINNAQTTNVYPPDGNVGIGATSPTSRLVVQSNSGQTESLAQFKISDAPNDYFQILNATGSPNQFIPSITGHHQSDNRPSIYIVGSTSDTNDNGNHSIVTFDARRPTSSVQTRPLFSWTSYTTKMMTMTANGNLGIGTTNPLFKLHIKNPIGGAVLGIERGGKTWGVDIENTGDRLFFRHTNNPNVMTIDHRNGSINIGTTKYFSDYKLSVNGKIQASEIKVHTGWADFVFKKNYNLPTLQEVENHIIEKGHLPNIPSAKEVEQNGIHLGEMNAKLLQKIEELTLYVIEQNKKTEQLQKEIALLKKKIK